MEAFMDLEEKVSWGAFLPWILGCGYYLTALLRWNNGGSHWPLGGVLIGMLLVQVVYMIVVSAVSRKEPRDERTRLIEYKGYKVAYLAVEAVFSGWLLWLYLPQHWNEPHKELPLLLAVWLGVEAIRMGTQLVLYRASVRA
jgi:hypothetical protein